MSDYRVYDPKKYAPRGDEAEYQMNHFSTIMQFTTEVLRDFKLISIVKAKYKYNKKITEKLPGK